MEENDVSPHLVINMAHSGGIKARNNGNRYGGTSDTYVNNESAVLKCKQAPPCQRWLPATEEKIKSCTSGSGIVRTRPPRDEAIIKVGIVCH